MCYDQKTLDYVARDEYEIFHDFDCVKHNGICLPIDKKIVPMIREIWDNGIETFFSCQGDENDQGNVGFQFKRNNVFIVWKLIEKHGFTVVGVNEDRSPAASPWCKENWTEDEFERASKITPPFTESCIWFTDCGVSNGAN